MVILSRSTVHPPRMVGYAPGLGHRGHDVVGLFSTDGSRPTVGQQPGTGLDDGAVLAHFRHRLPSGLLQDASDRRSKPRYHIYQLCPLEKNQHPLADIEKVEARTYKPLREYGGWGIRGLANHRAYNVSGSQGVELTLRDGRRILIGSQKAQELALAIQSQLPK